MTVPLDIVLETERLRLRAADDSDVELIWSASPCSGNIGTAGGCLASQYLAAWIIARTEGEEAARDALHYVDPVGEKDEYISRALKNIKPYLANDAKHGER